MDQRGTKRDNAADIAAVLGNVVTTHPHAAAVWSARHGTQRNPDLIGTFRPTERIRHMVFLVLRALQVLHSPRGLSETFQILADSHEPFSQRRAAPSLS